MKLMFCFKGTMQEYLEVISHQIYREYSGLIFSKKIFFVSPSISFDLAFVVETGEVSGGAYISSENDIKPQMLAVHAECQKLFCRVIPDMSYSPAMTWEQSSDAKWYIEKTDNRLFIGLTDSLII